jgi:hypothetical protein
MDVLKDGHRLKLISHYDHLLMKKKIFYTNFKIYLYEKHYFRVRITGSWNSSIVQYSRN